MFGADVLRSALIGLLLVLLGGCTSAGMVTSALGGFFGRMMGEEVAENSEADAEQTASSEAPALPVYAAQPAPPPDPPVVARFKALASLHKAQLVTDAEFNLRRHAYSRAILPLSAKGGPRPYVAPSRASARDTAERLKTLKSFSDQQLISSQDYAAERRAIIDALLPAEPQADSGPEPAPPATLEEAEMRLRALRDYLKGGLISTAEYEAEKAAVLAAVRPAPPAPAPPVRSLAEMKPQPIVPEPGPAMPAAKAAPAVATAPAASGDAGPAAPAANAPPPPASSAQVPAAPTAAGVKTGGLRLHLASYRRPEEAERGWLALRQKHGEVLDGLAHDVERVTLKKKGLYFRLYAGPVADRPDAERVCAALKARKAYCEIAP